MIEIILILLGINLILTSTYYLNKTHHQSHYYENFHHIYHNSGSKCTVYGENKILNRHDSNNFIDFEEVRNWTLHEKTYNMFSTVSNELLPLCNNITEYLASMQKGQRTKSSSNSNSIFIPYHCNYRWYNEHEACDIMSKFSYVDMIGDSIDN